MPPSPTAGLSVGDQWIERLLESTGVKALVVLLIALSLLPALDRPWLHGVLFLPVFGVEFLLRLRLFVARRRSIRRRSARGEPVHDRERRPWEPLLLAFDLLAVVSFVPLWHLCESGRLLRLARLARLAIVVRYAADLLHDLWVVVTRRERLGQLVLLLLTVATLSFVSAALLLYANPESPLHRGDVVEAFWWSFLQMESADNIVRTLHDHPATVVASVLLTLTGIFLMAFVIGLGTNVVGALVVAARHRPLDLEGHLVLGAPPGAARRILRDLRRLEPRNVRERPGHEGGFRSPARRIRRWLGGRRIVLAGADPEPPTFLLDADLRGVSYRPTALVDDRGATLVAADQARCVTLVPDDVDPAGDARCLSSALAVSEALVRAAVEDATRLGGPVPRDLFLELRATASLPAARPIRDRLHEAGIGCAVLDMESLLGRFLATHVLDPGLDPIYDQVLATAGQTLWVRLTGEDPGRRAAGRAPGLSAELPLARSWRDHRVVPLGLLVARPGAAPPRGASPLRRTWNCTAQLGLGPGAPRPPADRVAGLVVLALNEHLARDWARQLAAGRLDEPDPEPSAPAVRLAETLELAGHDLRRVLLVGSHPSLPALLAELVRFVPGIEVELLPETTTTVEELAAGLRESLRSAAPDATLRRDGTGPLRLTLADGRQGGISLHGAEGRLDAAAHVVERGDLERFDRVAFLSHPAAPAGDDCTTARVLRIADEATRLDRCRVVVQLESESRAGLLARAVHAHARPGSAPPISVLAAEQVRSHLLAHAMLTPGIIPVLEQLLAERGDEFVRLAPAPGTEPSADRVSFGDLLAALARRGPGSITAVGWALEREGRWSVTVNPEPAERPRLDEIRAVYAVANSARLREPTTGPGGRTGR
ncbi:MAG: hypothetical protein JXB32_05440 [Deltaproteobacteria bacterium]|nr:hypothetical protein [Deltaproteobacteria bacterium]